MPASAQPDPNPTVVGIWSNVCHSSSITVSNTACGSLGVGSSFTVQINVTNAPTVQGINGFELWLYYDPAYLNATGFDSSSTVFDNPNVLAAQFTPGQIHLAIVNFGSAFGGANGTLVNISFKIMDAGISPLTLVAGMAPASNRASGFTQLTVVSASNVISPFGPETSDGYFKNISASSGPVASFTFSPAIPRQGQIVALDARASFDPDNAGAANQGISRFLWDFGNGFSTSTNGPLFNYTFAGNGAVGGAFYGNFSVRLTVVDGVVPDASAQSGHLFEGMQVNRVYVSQTPWHDLIAQDIVATPSSANPGTKVTVTVRVIDNGTFTENYNLNLTYAPPTVVVETLKNQSIDSGATKSFTIIMNTTGIPPGFYTLTANVTVIPSSSNPSGIDQEPSTNIARTVLQMLGTSSSSAQLLIVIGGAVAVVAALAIVGLVLKRRRQARASS